MFDSLLAAMLIWPKKKQPILLRLLCGVCIDTMHRVGTRPRPYVAVYLCDVPRTSYYIHMYYTVCTVDAVFCTCRHRSHPLLPVLPPPARPSARQPGGRSRYLHLPGGGVVCAPPNTVATSVSSALCVSLVHRHFPSRRADQSSASVESVLRLSCTGHRPLLK